MKLLIHIDFMVHCVKLVVVKSSVDGCYLVSECFMETFYIPLLLDAILYCFAPKFCS